MKKQLLRLCTLCMLLVAATTAKAGDNDLKWDYTETAPSSNPDNGLYYASKVSDAAGTNNGLKGIKLNSSGYAFFAKAAVAGKLSLTIGLRSGSGDFCVDVYRCTIANGQATKGEKIATTEKVQEQNTVTVDIPADVTGIYIQRNTAAEGVLSKIVFKEAVARDFVDFEITNEQLSGTFDASTLPAGVTFTGTMRGDSHGYGNVTISVPVDGTVKFTIGGCQYANPATCKVTNANGTQLAEPNLKTAKCYHEDKSSVTYIYTGEPTTLTFSEIAYLPYFKAEATDVQEVTVTYKDQNGTTLGTKKVYEGDAIGEVPYTVADLTIPSGSAFRGWVYANGVKVKASDTVTGNVTVKASVTPIESVNTGSIQIYDLTSNIFYPEDHETFSVEGGSYYNNHGFTFSEGGSFTFDVAGKAQVVLTLCQYGDATTFTVTDAAGNVLKNDLPAKAENDGGTTSFNYDGPATKLTFTWAKGGYLHKISVYNVNAFIEKDEATNTYNVPAGDGAAFILAVNSANAEGNTTIYLPNGTYDLGKTTLTTISGKNITIKGESQTGVIIQNLPEVEGIGVTATLYNTSEGLTLEDLTLKNLYPYYDPVTGQKAGSAGRAVCLQDKGNLTVCRRVTLLSYQDTYYSCNNNGYFYFDNCDIHGLVDFVCGGGDVFYENTTFTLESREVTPNKGDVTIAAPNGSKKYGYVMQGCTIDCLSATFNWGRSWGSPAYLAWLNTTVKQPNKIASSRFTIAGMNSAADGFFEYKTVDESGNVISPASKVIEFTHASGNKKYETILTDAQAENYTKAKVFADTPESFKTRVGINGETAITTIGSMAPSVDAIYNLNGMRVQKTGKGLYIVNGKKVVIK